MTHPYVDAEHFKVDPTTLGLHTLYPPKGKHVTAIVDIVAVHGLGGSAFGTWTSPGPGDHLWLRDLLPEELKREVLTADDSDVRVLTFGYDASIFVQSAESSAKRLQSHALMLLSKLMDDRERKRGGAERPIIFLGHSLGGLVIKQALLLAHNRSDQYAPILKILGRISQSLSMAHKSQSAKALETWSPELKDLAALFAERAAKLSITTYYETVAEPGNVMVVDEGSSVMNIPGERPVPLSKTHREMCRFASMSDPAAQDIIGRLSSDVDDIYQKILDKSKEDL